MVEKYKKLNIIIQESEGFRNRYTIENKTIH